MALAKQRSDEGEFIALPDLVMTVSSRTPPSKTEQVLLFVAQAVSLNPN